VIERPYVYRPATADVMQHRKKQKWCPDLQLR